MENEEPEQGPAIAGHLTSEEFRVRLVSLDETHRLIYILTEASVIMGCLHRYGSVILDQSPLTNIPFGIGEYNELLQKLVIVTKNNLSDMVLITRGLEPNSLENGSRPDGVITTYPFIAHVCDVCVHISKVFCLFAHDPQSREVTGNISNLSMELQETLTAVMGVTEIDNEDDLNIYAESLVPAKKHTGI